MFYTVGGGRTRYTFDDAKARAERIWQRQGIVVGIDRAPIKRGARVEYVGSMTPRLNGKRGTFTRYGRNGWAHVRFDGDDGESLPCADCNLRELEEGEA